MRHIRMAVTASTLALLALGTGRVEAVMGFNNFERIEPTPFNSNYFIYGQTDHTDASDGQDVKFQISVKTKVFRGSRGGWGWANGLTFAYTQMSIFDINGRSAPFRATNYNPEVVFVWDDDDHPWLMALNELRLSLYDHHSTGVGSTDSRRWERMYVEPTLARGPFTLRAKYWWETPYKDGLSTQNEDIEDYLGHGRLALRFEAGGDRVVVEGLLTRGDETGNNYSVEISWRPLRLDFYLFGQFYDGYGEELIDYDVETRSFRLGLRFN